MLNITKKALWPNPVYEAHFSDGTVQRMSFYQTRGKPWDYGRGRRLCQSAHDLRHQNGACIVAGYVEWDETNGPWHRINDPMQEQEVPVKRKNYKAALQSLVAYLDGEHDDSAVVEQVRELLAA